MKEHLGNLELPVKYAVIAALVFAISSYVLGYAYQALALAAVGGAPHGSSWPEIREITAFSFDRTIRYFTFYLITFLSLACLERHPLKSSRWTLLILFAGLPAVMPAILFLFSNHPSQVNGYWALLAMLISLIYVGGGFNVGSYWMRIFFCALVAWIVLSLMIYEGLAWLNEVHRVLPGASGGQPAISDGSLLLYLAAPWIVSLLVKVYWVYVLPLTFVKALRGQAQLPDS